MWIKWLHHYYSHDLLNYSPRSDDSHLIKSLIKIINELRANGESSVMVTERLLLWFNGTNKSLDIAYRWFSTKDRNWPWKAILCKQGILPKHKISFWLFAHRKFLTRDRQIHYRKEVFFVERWMNHLITYSFNVRLRRSYGQELEIAWE